MTFLSFMVTQAVHSYSIEEGSDPLGVDPSLYFICIYSFRDAIASTNTFYFKSSRQTDLQASTFIEHFSKGVNHYGPNMKSF